MKVLGKDSRRTQMIQALRDKIRSMELVMDVIKVELGKSEHPARGKMSAEEVNEFVVEKTVGGPKRFRPLTREEMENKIAALEKSLLIKEKSLSKSAGGGGGGGDHRSVAGSVAGSRANSIAGSRAGSRPGTARSRATDHNGRDRGKENETDDEGKGNEVDNSPSAVRSSARAGAAAAEAAVSAANERDTARIISLMEEVEALRMALDVAEGSVELQKEEVSRLRQRNSELVAGEEEADFNSRQYREMKASYDAMQGEGEGTCERRGLCVVCCLSIVSRLCLCLGLGLCLCHGHGPDPDPDPDPGPSRFF